MSETAIIDSPYADEHGLRRVLPEHAVSEAKRQLRWHEWRPWSAPHLKPHRPTEDACGACGKPKDVHPIPFAPLEGYLGGALLVEMFGLTPPDQNGRSEDGFVTVHGREIDGEAVVTKVPRARDDGSDGGSR